MQDRPTETPREGQTPPRRDFAKREGEQSFQEDWDLAWDAAHALEGELGEPDSKLPQSTFTRYELGTKEARKQILPTLKRLFDRLRGEPEKRQKNITIFLEATEREAKRERVDGLCGQFGVLDQAGIESIARAEVLKMKNERLEAARGFAVSLIDIDGLGVINDTLGHEAGDGLIVGIGREISETVRGTDFIGRSRGDEFVLLLPVNNEEMAKTIMEVAVRNRKGDSEPGIVNKFLSRAEDFRASLKAKYGERYPKDDPKRAKGKNPGDVSIGWSYVSKAEMLEKYNEYEESKKARSGKSFTGILTREADLAMYQMKQAKALRKNSPPDDPRETVPT